MKTSTLLASAVALAVSGMATAGDGGLYGSLRTNLISEGTLKVTDGSSRYGFKAQHDIGDGTIGFYRLEHSFNGATGAAIGGRLGYVGIKGGFGSISLGQQWSPYYNHVLGASDPFANGGLASNNYVTRISNSLAYSNTAGAVSFGAMAQMNPADGTDGEDIDRITFGASLDLGGMTVGFGIDNIEGGDSDTGVSVKGKAGDLTWVALLQAGDADDMAFTVATGPFTAQFGINNDNDDTHITAMYTKKLSKKVTTYFTFQENDGADDTRLAARLRVDF